MRHASLQQELTYCNISTIANIMLAASLHCYIQRMLFMKIILKVRKDDWTDAISICCSIKVNMLKLSEKIEQIKMH